MGKKKMIIIIILVLIIGGFFYSLYIQDNNDNNQDLVEEGPVLFDKEDYKVEEREDDTYILIEKVGLSCKVPQDWDIIFQGEKNLESGIWIDLFSEDLITAEDKILESGCIISINGQKTKEKNQNTKEDIILIQQNSEETTELIKRDYALAEDIELINITGHKALKITYRENSPIGGGTSLEIPFSNYNLVTFGVGFPLKDKEKCLSAWENFLQNIVIK